MISSMTGLVATRRYGDAVGTTAVTVPDPALRLRTPLATLPAGRLLAHWSYRDLRLLVRRPRNFSADAGLADRLRCGWARRVQHAGASDARAAQARRVLLGDLGNMDDGGALPRPYVFRLYPGHRSFEVALLLFGFASSCHTVAAEALLAACQSGVAPYEGARSRVRLEPLALWQRQVEGLPPVPLADRLFLWFSSPLLLRTGGRQRAGLSSLPSRMIRRVAGVARWMDCALDSASLAVEFEAGNIRIEAGEATAASYLRYRRGMPGLPQLLGGAAGLVEITGNLAPLLPVTAAAETCHVGNGCALGLGAFEVLAGPARESPVAPLFQHSDGALRREWHVVPGE